MNLNFKKGIIDYIHKDSKNGTIIYPRTLASAVYDKNGEPISNKLNTGMYKESDTEDNVVTFESGDSLSFNSWTDVDILESGESHKSIFNKLSIMVKNVRYLYKILGNTDISSINNGTVTGALNLLTSETSTLKKSVADGKASIANALSAQGQSTAVDAAFATMANNIITVGNNQYSAGITFADGRENPDSVNYQSGYNAGITTADERVAQNETWNYLVELQHSSLLNGTNSFGAWIALYSVLGYPSTKTYSSLNINGGYGAPGARSIWEGRVRVSDIIDVTYQLLVGVGDINAIVADPTNGLLALWGI